MFKILLKSLVTYQVSEFVIVTLVRNAIADTGKIFVYAIFEVFLLHKNSYVLELQELIHAETEVNPFSLLPFGRAQARG
jgi:hypothetical protein